MNTKQDAPSLFEDKDLIELHPSVAQHQAPLFDAMRKYIGRDMAAFHTPGHKQGSGMPTEMIELFGQNLFRMDLCELPEVDNLHEPVGVIKEAQELAAAAYGSDHTFFLVNGSTIGNMAMIMTVCSPGDKILVTRNCHKSVIAGLIYSGADPVYLEPYWDTELNLAHSICAAEVVKMLDRHPDAKAVLILSPTYFGGSADLKTIAEACHQKGIPLLVDEAHGPHFTFHPELPGSALEAGADMVVQSTHKILSGMTQSSMLHVRGTIIRHRKVHTILQLLQSTSPNYVLMASLDTARRQMAVHGYELLDKTVQLAHLFRKRLNSIPLISVFGIERCNNTHLFALDETKITIDVTQLGLTGYQVRDILNKDFNIQVEMATLHHVLLILSIGNTDRDISKVLAAFSILSTRQRKASPLHFELPAFPERLIKMTPREAFFSAAETLPISSSIGRVSSEIVAPYPPGIPVLSPGEVITSEALIYLKNIKKMGGAINGPQDVSLNTVQVVRE